MKHQQSSTKLEAEIKSCLMLRTQEQWLGVITQFRGNMRTRLACVIWWDFYGIRQAKKRWSNLDHFVKLPHVDCDTSKLRLNLIKCGYSDFMATIRAVNVHQTNESRNK